MTTNIEWTKKTWNPTAGCSLMRPGCTNCYAMKFAHRLAATGNAGAKYRGLTRSAKNSAVWTGVVRMDERNLLKPLAWKKPTFIFTNSMSDLFHPGLSLGNVARIWAIMALARRHAFHVLTKRPDRMRDWLNSPAPRQSSRRNAEDRSDGATA